MCHAAVRAMLGNDPILNDYGITTDLIWATGAMDVAPRSGYFLILRWEETSFVVGTHGPEQLTVICHRSRKETRDYTNHRKILMRVVDILTEYVHVEGEDGIFNQARAQGLSADQVDEVYETITKNASFSVLGR
jgi:hypothetical protein